MTDDNLQIIAGHGRVEAAKLLGMSLVPTVRLSHLSEADKRPYVLADNKLAEEAGWDREILAIELQGLIDLGVPVEITGFEIAEIDLRLDEARESRGSTPAEPEDNTPPYAAGSSTTQTGDMCVKRIQADQSSGRTTTTCRLWYGVTSGPGAVVSIVNVGGWLPCALSRGQLSP